MTIEQVGMSFLNKPLAKANIKDLSAMLNVGAVLSEKMRLNLAANGVDCAVNPIVMKALSSDAFTKSGELTEKASQRIIEMAEANGHSPSMTIREALKMLTKNAETVVETPPISELKFSHPAILDLTSTKVQAQSNHIFAARNNSVVSPTIEAFEKKIGPDEISRLNCIVKP